MALNAEGFNVNKNRKTMILRQRENEQYRAIGMDGLTTIIAKERRITRWRDNQLKREIEISNYSEMQQEITYRKKHGRR